MTVKLFPYALLRYAAMDFSALKALEIPDLPVCLENRALQEQTFRQLQVQLCEQLYTAIQQAADNDTRQLLLRWKRAVFNGRTPPEEIPEALHAPLQDYRQQHYQRQRAYEAWQAYYAEQLLLHRRQLQSWSGNEALRKGILLSSPVLFSRLHHFIAADPAAFRAGELKNEYSLLRYITRMAAKTSPFSTFTYTGVSSLQPGVVAPATVTSNIRLNNSLFTYLRSLLVHHPVINELMEVKLNATVTMDDTHLRFLVNYFNVEAFQSLPARNIALWLFQHLKTSIRLGTLTDILMQQIPDTPREQIKSFLMKLSASGFLELGIGCSGMDPEWDHALMEFLSDSQPESIARETLNELLRLLAHHRNLYAASDAAMRAQLLETTATALNTVLLQLQQEAALPVNPALPSSAAAFEVHHFTPRHFLPSEIFYEDSYTREQQVLPEHTTTLTEKAERLCTLLAPYDLLQPERKRMLDFFLQQYDPTQQISVADFYHTYYLHVKKQPSADAGPTVMDIPDTVQLAINGEQVDVSGQKVVSPTPVSRGMFVQVFYPDHGAVMGVVNALLPGMGKVAGRFLHLFDPAITATFREWNKTLYPGHLMMELNDGSVFNANIHPPLLDHEITIPGGSNNYPPEQRVSLNDIVIRLAAEPRQLELYHVPSGKPVYTFDLCLESFYNRSHFYRLLAHFNPEPRLPLRSFIMAVDQYYHSVVGPVQILPRIVFENRLVLRRKGWLVTITDIPVPVNDETEADYFLRLQYWRSARSLPQQVFVFLKSPYIPARDGKKGQLHRDDYKPQYINFTQPLLVNVFRKMITRAGGYCYMEEVLPDASQRGTVTEHMLHWYQY
ncbi:lantibiotic dehydratase [Chitinophaga qingshengii]|uniref:Lantibiotic dehydratase n=1 Tax=Chitinophaga qingshengii TaxID=1569794 RepID=A0ABR7TQZ7_9BACT|nr:lantibiotic dehydratase [Chitinophaga qingshengii]MBC9932023.1 lantibiotic dehydratase [Chitinophaga qingshengii]